jgi:hypothetical protein
VIVTNEPQPLDVGQLKEDERLIIEALRGTGVVGERLKKEMEANKNKAKYKIEILFGSNRSVLLHKPSKGVITIWESGKRFHGGGDEKMYWCGWNADWKHTPHDKVCGKPIETRHFGFHHVVCPHCQRECFLEPDGLRRHREVLIKSGMDPKGLDRLPIVSGERYFLLTPKNLALTLVRYWRDLGGNADIFVKYHPTDIRCREVAEVKKADHYTKARTQRPDGLLIYPLARIIRDVTNGASLESRFVSMLTS